MLAVEQNLFVVLYCNFTSLAFLGLLVLLRRQLKITFLATLLRAAKMSLETRAGAMSSMVPTILQRPQAS